MAKKIIQKYMPDINKIREHKYLRIFGRLLHDPRLWHLNRRSVSGAFGIGLFMAFLPVPLQMVPAAAAAIIFRINLPIAVALVWITNPLTMAPVTYAAYKIGNWVLAGPVYDFAFEASWTWLTTQLHQIWQPFVLGSLIIAAACGLSGFFTTRALWRLYVIREWRVRKKNRRPKSD